MEIDGNKIGEEIIADLENRKRPNKFLGAVVIGNGGKSFGFLEKKKTLAARLGIDFRIYKLPADINNDRARAGVLKVAQHKTCGGVFIQLPLPKHLNPYYIANAIPREKDVDVLGERALGAFYNGRNFVLPPAVGTVEYLLGKFRDKLELKNIKVAVVGAGFLVGKPVIVWFLGKAKEIIVLDKGSDFALLREADLVISGVGKPGLIKSAMLKRGAAFIDFGYGVENGKISGDLDTSSEGELNNLAFYTPTPGGTGPILIAKLLENFFNLNKETD